MFPKKGKQWKKNETQITFRLYRERFWKLEWFILSSLNKLFGRRRSESQVSDRTWQKYRNPKHLLVIILNSTGRSSTSQKVKSINTWASKLRSFTVQLTVFSYNCHYSWLIMPLKINKQLMKSYPINQSTEIYVFMKVFDMKIRCNFKTCSFRFVVKIESFASSIRTRNSGSDSIDSGYRFSFRDALPMRQQRKRNNLFLRGQFPCGHFGPSKFLRWIFGTFWGKKCHESQ